MQRIPHRIRRQRWTVRAGSAEDAFAIRKGLRDQWQGPLLSAFEKEFDEVENGEQVIHILRLELHIQVRSEEDLEKILPDLIRQQLREKLQALLNSQVHLYGKKAAPCEESTPQQHRFDILLHYLLTGSILWQAADSPPSEIADDLGETCRRQWSQLLEYLHKNDGTETFYFRLFQLIWKENESGFLIGTLSDQVPQSWRKAIVEVIALLSSEGQRSFSRYTRLKLAAAFFRESVNKRENNTAPNLLSVAEKALGPAEMQTLPLFVTSLSTAASVLFQWSAEETAPFLLASPDALCQQKEDAGRAADDDPLEGSISDINETTKIDPSDSVGIAHFDPDANAASGLIEKEAARSAFPFKIEDPLHRSPEKDDFGLMVYNAGLIVLHPFLSRFFENTGIKEIGCATLLSDALPRAASLLHYMATGREEVYEFELGFIKVLLGLHPEIPLLVSSGMIKQGDQEEAEALLQSVIGYWSSLKKTYIDGLRTSFLQRQALLYDGEYDWKLQVERKTFDMLLDQLPWSISIIKLPWIIKTIYTEW